jgi:hypothetical protein
MLLEPPKARLLDFYHGRGPAPARRALVWATRPPAGTLFEAVVELGAGGGGDAVVSWKRVRPLGRDGAGTEAAGRTC